MLEYVNVTILLETMTELCQRKITEMIDDLCCICFLLNLEKKSEIHACNSRLQIF